VTDHGDVAALDELVEIGAGILQLLGGLLDRKQSIVGRVRG
jgi:hypothetical protein